MIGLIQRVSSASVTVANNEIGQINQGFLVLLGVEKDDNQQKADLLLNKILNLRVFNDENNKMNLNIQQIDGELLVVSQFTLTAEVKKGNRPGFSNGASPDLAENLYLYFCKQSSSQIKTATGQFGADMQVSLVNDGPVTFWIQI